MGYSDQKYYDRKQIPMSDPVAFTGTFTASSATNSVAAAAYRIPTFARKTKVNGIKMVIRTASTTGKQVFSFMNGTNTFATATNSSTNAAGVELIATLTNTASTAVTTQTTTYANGGTAVSTVTTTTDWSVFGSSTGIQVVVQGTSTASGDTWGAFDLEPEVQEAFV